MRREDISVCRSWMVGLLFMAVMVDSVAAVPVVVMAELVGAAAAAMADLEDARGRMALE